MTRHLLPLMAWLAAALLVPSAGCEIFHDGSEAAAQDEEQGAYSPALSCFDAADRRTILSEQEALRLCWGATSTGPIQCFEEADDTTTLTDTVAIELCRCAEGLTPVRCYQQYTERLLVNSPLVVEWCRPIRARQLTADCIPVRQLR